MQLNTMFTDFYSYHLVKSIHMNLWMLSYLHIWIQSYSLESELIQASIFRVLHVIHNPSTQIWQNVGLSSCIPTPKRTPFLVLLLVSLSSGEGILSSPLLLPLNFSNHQKHTTDSKPHIRMAQIPTELCQYE